MIKLLRDIARIRPLQKKPTDHSEALASVLPDDITDEESLIIDQVRGLTMTSVERQISLCRILDFVLTNKIRGDFVECGVWRGGSSMIAASKFRSSGANKRLWLYDTFEGMPAPDDSVDISCSKVMASQILAAESNNKSNSLVWAIGSEEEVAMNLSTTGFDMKSVELIKGRVEETIPLKGIPEEICVLRLDTDWYSSTLHELNYLYPLVATGGFVIIDDYGHWQGARKATDEYLKAMGLMPYLHRIDYTCRVIQKV